MSVEVRGRDSVRHIHDLLFEQAFDYSVVCVVFSVSVVPVFPVLYFLLLSQG